MPGLPLPGETGTETGEEAMSEDKKPEPFKKKTIRLTGWVLVKKKADPTSACKNDNSQAKAVARRQTPPKEAGDREKR